jgi:hypothetical protein
MSDDDTISSLFPEVVEFVMDLGVELEDSITDMLAINSDDHPVVPMNLQVIMGSNDRSNQSKQTLNCLQLMTTSDASAMVLPYDRGPVFTQPCIHTDALSVLLSALYLYPLLRVLIQRRTCTSGAGSSLFCALTIE